jgi:hypothetical protein
MPTSWLIALLGMGLTGCMTLPSKQATDKPLLMPTAQPLAPARRIVQQINAVWADHQESLLVVLELDARHIAMAGLSNDGLSLFNLSYDGAHLQADKSPLLPASFVPEFFIADMQLVYWPVTVLQKILPSGWRLKASEKRRLLTIDNKKHIEVNYLTPDATWPKDVELVNFKYHYQLHIKTLSYDLVPE